MFLPVRRCLNRSESKLYLSPVLLFQKRWAQIWHVFKKKKKTKTTNYLNFHHDFCRVNSELPGEIVTSRERRSSWGQNGFIRKLLDSEERTGCWGDTIFVGELSDFGGGFFDFRALILVIHFLAHGGEKMNGLRNFDSGIC